MSSTSVNPYDRESLLQRMRKDPFSNYHLDLTDIDASESDPKSCVQAFKASLPLILKNAEDSNTHVVTIKFATRQIKYGQHAIQSGFVYHQAHPEYAIVFKCLLGHEHSECTYPKYKTASIGITIVLFRKEMTEFLAVQENQGPYRGWKAPTGTVDYEKGTTPSQTAVIELREETGVAIQEESLLEIAHAWTPNFRGSNPDINYVFTATLKEGEDSPELRPQEAEIRCVGWKSVAEFLSEALPVSHSKPLIMKGVVEAARAGLGWKSQPMYWGSGKEASFSSTIL